MGGHTAISAGTWTRGSIRSVRTWSKAIVPDYALSSRVAPLGLTFNTGSNLPLMQLCSRGSARRAPTSSAAPCGGNGDRAVAEPPGKHAPAASRTERRQRCQQKVAKGLAILALFARVAMAASCDGGDCAAGAL